jgi:Transcriptional regulator, AbiEi antitoxin, Type IV TA system
MYIYQMVNMTETINRMTLLEQTQPLVLALLKRIPQLQARFGKPSQASEDFRLNIKLNGQMYALQFMAQPSAEPRQVRTAIAAFSQTLHNPKPGIITYGVLIAPWISQTSRQLLEEAGLGYLDLQGNAHLQFGAVFIERLGATAPKVAKRELRSLWKPASARVLRVLLREPDGNWNLLKLAQAAQVSHAQAYKIKTALLDQNWLEERGKARFKTVRLTHPEALLNAWREAYQALGQRTTWYSMLERDELEHTLQSLKTPALERQIALASFSAARHLSPYARVPSEFFYATQHGLNALQKALDLQTVHSGENVIVFLEPDTGVFLDAILTMPMTVTSPVQTYLDLNRSGNRGIEAATHLLETRIRPAWNQS